MRAYLTQSFVFDAAHTLHRHVPLREYEASIRVHGHTYTVEVTIAGVLRDGMIWLPRTAGHKAREADIFLLRSACDKARALLDHRLLDEVPQLGRPTMENIAAFVGRSVVADGLPVSTVSVGRQTGDSCLVEFA